MFSMVVSITATSNTVADAAPQPSETLMNHAEKNAEVIRRAYEAFNTADMETLVATFDERASWHTPGRSPVAGDTPDREATFAQFGRYVGETNGTFRAVLQNLFTGEEGRVVALHHNIGERNGKQLDVYCCITFVVENGRIIEGREHFADVGAWDTFWA